MKWEQSQILIGGVVLVLVAGSAGFWLGRANGPKSNSSNPQAVTQPNNPPPGVISGGILGSGRDRVSVMGQVPGMQVTIGAFSISKDGWVVVHEDAAGRPGNILGAQRYDAGSYESGAVDLLRGMENGKTYYAMLHADDGDRMFDKAKDLPIVGSDGSPVMTTFKASAQ